jgi:tetratricopeptide (TPR) repeat protein
MVQSAKQLSQHARSSMPIVAVLLGGCIGTSYPKTPAHGGPAWQEMTTEHFVVDTDLESAEATVIARQLENLRNAMAETVFGGQPPPGPRVRVLALRQDEYRHFDRSSDGYFLSSALYQPLLITSPGGDWDTFDADVRKHELAHYVSSLYVDTRLQPKWFAEGLAGYLETILYDEKTGALEIGHAHANYQYLHLMRQATPEELWGWGSETASDDLTARLYQTSWAALHYLFDQRPAELLDYERALARGEDSRESWKRIFPDLDDEGLATVIRKYVHKRDFKIKKTKVAPVAVTTKVRSLDESDVLGFRAALHMALQPQSKRAPDESKKLAIENVTASLQQSESSFWAHQVNLFYFDKVPGSSELAKKTIAGEKDNWLAWVWYAEVLRRAKGPIGERRSALTKALELAPNSRVALTQLAWVEANAGNWPAALDAAEKAVRRPPVDSDSVVVYVVALSYSGKCSEARAAEEAYTKRAKTVSKDVTEMFQESRKACESPPTRPSR